MVDCARRRELRHFITRNPVSLHIQPIISTKCINKCHCPTLNDLLTKFPTYTIAIPHCDYYIIIIASKAHQRESLHAYCYNCGILSPTRTLHVRHMQLHDPVPAMTPRSATQFWCCDCKHDFRNEAALADHLRCSKLHGLGKGGKKKKTKNNKRRAISERSARSAKGLSRIGVR